MTWVRVDGAVTMLLRHSSHYLLARGLPGLLNFVALLVFTRLLTPDEYGRYALVVAGVSMAGALVFQWQRLVLARWLSSRLDDASVFLGETLWVFVRLALAFGVAGVVLSLLWPDPVWQRLLALSILLFGLQGWFELNLILAAAQLSPGRYGRMLGAKTLVALLVGSALAWFGLGVYAPLIGLLVGCVLAVPLFGRGIWRDVRLVRPETTALREQMLYGFPLIATFLLGWVTASSDRFLIGWLLDVNAVGQYAVGYDLAQQSLGMLLAVVQVAAYPLAITALETRGVDAARMQVRDNGELIVAIALASAAGIAILSPQLSGVVVGKQYGDVTASLLPWVALAAAIAGIKSFHFDLAFHLGRDSRGLAVSAAAAGVANVGLNIILIPRFGVRGAAYATVFAYALALASSAWLGRRKFPMPPVVPLFFKAGSVAVAAAAGASAGGAAGEGLLGLLAGISFGASLAAFAAFAVNLAGLRRALVSVL